MILEFQTECENMDKNFKPLKFDRGIKDISIDF